VTGGREAVGRRATAGPRRPTPSQVVSPHYADFGRSARSTRCCSSCSRAGRPGSAVSAPQAEHNASAASKRRSAPHRSHLAAAGALPSSPAVALSVSRCFHSEHHPSQSVHVCVRRRDFRTGSGERSHTHRYPFE